MEQRPRHFPTNLVVGEGMRGSSKVLFQIGEARGSLGRGLATHWAET